LRERGGYKTDTHSRTALGIYKTRILPVVLYGCEIWSLTLREVFEKRVLRRIFGPKRDEVTGIGENCII
jgi:hypothetical protein